MFVFIFSEGKYSVSSEGAEVVSVLAVWHQPFATVFTITAPFIYV